MRCFAVPPSYQTVEANTLLECGAMGYSYESPAGFMGVWKLLKRWQAMNGYLVDVKDVKDWKRR